jgi:hypothetical protein
MFYSCMYGDLTALSGQVKCAMMLHTSTAENKSPAR